MLYQRTTPSNSMQPASLAHLLERVSRMLGSESGITGQSSSEETLHRFYNAWDIQVNQVVCLEKYRCHLTKHGYQLPPETTGEALWVRYIVDMFSAEIPTWMRTAPIWTQGIQIPGYIKRLDLCIAAMPPRLQMIIDTHTPGGDDRRVEFDTRLNDTDEDKFRRAPQLEQFKLFGCELLQAIFPRAHIQVRGRPILPGTERRGILNLLSSTHPHRVYTLYIEPPDGHPWYIMSLEFYRKHPTTE